MGLASVAAMRPASAIASGADLAAREKCFRLRRADHRRRDRAERDARRHEGVRFCRPRKLGGGIDQRQRLALAQPEFLKCGRLAEILFGMTISTSSSSGLRLVLRGPTKARPAACCAGRAAPATVTCASSAINVGPLSIDGTQVTRLPPSVPRLRVCTAPMVCAASTRAGNMLADDGRRHDFGVRDQRADA